MTLQNRVLPDGKIVAESWRGTRMGNRGGRIHDPARRTLLKRRWASRRWINCVTSFRGRQRQVMGHGYTELFFLDEVSALACGHRPCFECQREAASAFADAWRERHGHKESRIADAMDHLLHKQRLDPGALIPAARFGKLPSGTMATSSGRYYVRCGSAVLEWTRAGYRAADVPAGDMQVLTPAAIIAVLESGYTPQWHPSAAIAAKAESS